jgi:hypothetical protein
MKRLMFVFAMVIGQFAQAEESVWEYEGNKIQVVSFKKMTTMGFSISDEYVIPKEYTQKGVYIRAILANDQDPPNAEFPNATNIIKEQFVKSGVKVVDKLEDAGVAITFVGLWGWANIAAANIDAKYDDLGGKRYYKEQLGQYLADIKLSPVPAKDKSIFALKMINSSVNDGEQKNNTEITFKNLTPNIKSALQLRMFADYWIAAFVQK